GHRRSRSNLLCADCLIDVTGECEPLAQRLALRRFLGEALREAAVLGTAKSSSFDPAFSFSRTQTYFASLPAHVCPDLSRYLTATFRPFSELPRPFPLEPICCPSFESSSRNRAAL